MHRLHADFKACLKEYQRVVIQIEQGDAMDDTLNLPDCLRLHGRNKGRVTVDMKQATPWRAPIVHHTAIDGPKLKVNLTSRKQHALMQMDMAVQTDTAMEVPVTDGTVRQDISGLVDEHELVSTVVGEDEIRETLSSQGTTSDNEASAATENMENSIPSQHESDEECVMETDTPALSLPEQSEEEESIGQVDAVLDFYQTDTDDQRKDLEGDSNVFGSRSNTAEDFEVQDESSAVTEVSETEHEEEQEQQEKITPQVNFPIMTLSPDEISEACADEVVAAIDMAAESRIPATERYDDDDQPSKVETEVEVVASTAIVPVDESPLEPSVDAIPTAAVVPPKEASKDLTEPPQPPSARELLLQELAWLDTSIRHRIQLLKRRHQ